MATVRISEPHPALTASVAAALASRDHRTIETLTFVDSTAYLHDEANLLNAEELAEAKAALIEDGIYEPREWTDPDLRAATKYGWAIAHLLQSEAVPPVLWSVAGGDVPTTANELRFIVEDLRRRNAPPLYFSACWPVALEPAIDLDETADAFQTALASYAPHVRGSGLSLFIPNAAGKLSVLPAIAAELGDEALLDFASLGWLEAARLVANSEPALFRRILPIAQDHFALDKPRGALSTGEDDVRTLPDVPDADLAHIFLDDARGRQLLHVTAASIFADAEVRAALDAFIAETHGALDAAIAAEVERHFPGR